MDFHQYQGIPVAPAFPNIPWFWDSGGDDKVPQQSGGSFFVIP